MKKKMLPILMFALLVTLFTVVSSHAQMTINITSPQNGEAFESCIDIVFSVDIQVTSGTIKEVRYYYNGKSIGLNRKEPYSYTWKKTKPGYYIITSKVVDTDGNEFWANPIEIQVGNVLKGDQIINGGFDCSAYLPWTLQNYEGAVSQLHVLSDGYFEDSSYVYLDITTGSTADWHIQFQHSMPIVIDHSYELWFYADADGKKTISVSVQESHDPYTVYFSTPVDIDGPGEYGPYTFTATTDDPTSLYKFNLGGNDIPCMIDNVRLYDNNLTSVKAKDLSFTNKTVKEYELFQSYPNPFNMNTKIPFRLSHSAHVKLELYNMQGQKIKTLLNGVQSEGYHNIAWDGTNDSNSVLPSGVYIYRFQVESEKITLSNKVLLLK